MKLDTTRAAAGIVISIVVFALIVPVFYGWAVMRLDRLMGFEPIMSRPIASILTAAALVIGLFWVLWSYSFLLFEGLGSPFELFGKALSPTKKLVIIGPYAYTRNPMVLGYLWILLGIAIYCRSISGIALVPIVGVLSVIYLKYFEEPELVRRFGERYEHYRQHVPILFPSWSAYLKPEQVVEA